LRTSRSFGVKPAIAFQSEASFHLYWNTVSRRIT